MADHDRGDALGKHWRSVIRQLWPGALALACTGPAVNAQRPSDFNTVAIGQALQAELGDSVKASIVRSDRVRLSADGQLVADTTRYLLLEFPTRRFTMKDRAAQYAYLGHVVPRARRLAASVADVLGLRVSLELGSDSARRSEGAVISMAQAYQWLPGSWPTDSAAITRP